MLNRTFALALLSALVRSTVSIAEAPPSPIPVTRETCTEQIKDCLARDDKDQAACFSGAHEGACSGTELGSWAKLRAALAVESKKGGVRPELFDRTCVENVDNELSSKLILAEGISRQDVLKLVDQLEACKLSQPLHVVRP